MLKQSGPYEASLRGEARLLELVAEVSQIRRSVPLGEQPKKWLAKYDEFVALAIELDQNDVQMRNEKIFDRHDNEFADLARIWAALSLYLWSMLEDFENRDSVSMKLTQAAVTIRSRVGVVILSARLHAIPGNTLEPHEPILEQLIALSNSPLVWKEYAQMFLVVYVLSKVSTLVEKRAALAMISNFIRTERLLFLRGTNVLADMAISALTNAYCFVLEAAMSEVEFDRDVQRIPVEFKDTVRRSLPDFLQDFIWRPAPEADICSDEELEIEL